jgi:cysteine desulfurase
VTGESGPDQEGAGSPDERLVDSRGRRCPLPVIDLAKVAAAAPSGTLITVLADDPAARYDIPAWCRMRGQTFEGERDIDGAAAYLVRIS